MPKTANKKKRSVKGSDGRKGVKKRNKRYEVSNDEHFKNKSFVHKIKKYLHNSILGFIYLYMLKILFFSYISCIHTHIHQLFTIFNNKLLTVDEEHFKKLTALVLGYLNKNELK